MGNSFFCPLQRKDSKQAPRACEYCLDIVNFEDMIACARGHLFCHDCLQEKLNHSNNAQLQCFKHGFCNAKFSEELLKKSLYHEMFLDHDHETVPEECECCCVEVDFKDMVSCTEGHLFCQNCLKRYVQERLYGSNSATLQCLDTGGCKASFSDHFLEKALSQEVYTHYQIQAAIAVAQLALGKSLFTCPKCDTKAEIRKELETFECPDTECNAKTCVKCMDEGHEPISCEQHKEKKQTEGRVSIEEAMTNAFIRTCENCNARFLKNEGCNMITCSCGMFICYVCKKMIPEKYQHFCQVPFCTHESCNNCTLYANTTETDEKAIKAAAETATGVPV